MTDGPNAIPYLCFQGQPQIQYSSVSAYLMVVSLWNIPTRTVMSFRTFCRWKRLIQPTMWSVIFSLSLRTLQLSDCCTACLFGIVFSTSNFTGGPGSSVGIATELRAGRSGIESRWGRDFPPIQIGPVVHPASCKLGTGSFSGVKCGRGVLLTTHPLLVPQSWKSRAISLPTLWATSGL